MCNKHTYRNENIKTLLIYTLAGVAQWLSASLQIKGSLVQFPVYGTCLGCGPGPSKGCMRGNHTLIFPSLFLPLFLSLKINKMFLKIANLK